MEARRRREQIAVACLSVAPHSRPPAAVLENEAFAVYREPAPREPAWCFELGFGTGPMAGACAAIACLSVESEPRRSPAHSGGRRMRCRFPPWRAPWNDRSRLQGF